MLINNLYCNFLPANPQYFFNMGVGGQKFICFGLQLRPSPGLVQQFTVTYRYNFQSASQTWLGAMGLFEVAKCSHWNKQTALPFKIVSEDK